jgi:hypothetical protein
MRNVSDKNAEEIKTHFVFGNFSSENCAVSEINVEIYRTAGQATDDNMAHVHCTLDN